MLGVFVVACLVVGCGKEEPKPKPKTGGVEISGPGFNIKADEKGAQISAPGVDINAKKP
jgi:hypothetical protein